MGYSNFLENINGKFYALLNEISAEFNFDNGPEFEIAICKLLRYILPNRFGICRGFAITKDEEQAGDDIIIYDQERFPTLRLLEDNTFSQKQKIPIEAIYAYIEAKHTLCLNGSGGQSLEKAINQVKSVKSLTREKVPLTQITPHIKLEKFNPTRLPNWPDYFNPIYGAIFSRYVRINEKSSIENVDKFLPILRNKCRSSLIKNNAPDLIIAGHDSLVIPAINRQIESPFYMDGISYLEPFKSDGKAYGTGLISMMYALDYIELGKIHWPTILAEGLNLFLTNMKSK